MIGALISVQREARRAETVSKLRYVAVNELRRLVGYRVAVLFEVADSEASVVAISGVAAPEMDAPMVVFLGRLGSALVHGGASAGAVEPGELDSGLADEWVSWLPVSAAWWPMEGGGLLLAREESWSDNELLVVGEMADSFSHAARGLVGPRLRLAKKAKGRLALAGIGLALAMLALPVRMSVLAPGEVVAASPLTVGAPIDGVVSRVEVQPNQRVSVGDVLLRLDDTTLRAAAAVAAGEMEVAAAEWRLAQSGAMAGDVRAGGRVALAEAQMKLKQVELNGALDALKKSVVLADRAGVVLLQDTNDWAGRPVVTGQRVMSIANPSSVEIRVDVPVRDAVELRSGADLSFFMDIDPVSPVVGHILSASYEADMTSSGVLAYRVRGEIKGELTPRLGLQGTAKIYGEPVALGLFLFRRPVAALRQWVGW